MYLFYEKRKFFHIILLLAQKGLRYLEGVRYLIIEEEIAVNYHDNFSNTYISHIIVPCTPTITNSIQSVMLVDHRFSLIILSSYS